MNENDWNPDLYLKFDKERIQPSIDLVARIDFKNPGKIIDIGCGPGNSTQILFLRWPDSNITGADNSPAMIKKAKEDFPDRKWILLDAGKDIIEEKFDIVFSNATLQWIPAHERLIKWLSNLVNDNGILAVQLPLFFDMPVSKSISEVAQQAKWQANTKDVREIFTIHTPSFYYDLLADYFKQTDLWITDYFHVMGSHSAILEMIRTTALKPYLERLNNEMDKLEFESLLIEKIKHDYPLQADGKVLFPFKRLFFIAKR